ncbi:hypothetical protein FJ365_03385 [Candidatus Dependentiae bacterium]|nr:hypothetical protein [Candidatus Dependentiae bacterium]
MQRFNSRATTTLLQKPELFRATTADRSTTSTPTSNPTIYLSGEAVKDVISVSDLNALHHSIFMRKLTAIGGHASITGMSALEFVAKYNLALTQLVREGKEKYKLAAIDRIEVCRALAANTPIAGEIDTILERVYPANELKTITLTKEQIVEAIADLSFITASGLLETLAEKKKEAAEIIWAVFDAVSNWKLKLSEQHRATAVSIYIPFSTPKEFNNAGKRAMVHALLASHPIMQKEAEAAMIGFFEGKP